ncbi:hypothetical protein COCOR_04991 [Corallococcus coralloides DSM 2259]|uniref:Uncharacterized protein n=1 Tax=Corallococcus coralloides (strain ATCC 25202 / DSM 2259 / NBRC 100086 / M2) TaxID=1144275 RepID=H8MPV9_CORCM|nr:hypothetical protein [Corallococcus coralloides]AFE06136.1 hypothetical protein COCOR_04991 [Corallococcus coralloides DSM 2259]
MKVEGQDAPSGNEKVPPEKDAFKQVLQRTSERPDAPPRPGARREPVAPGPLPKPGLLRAGGQGLGPATRATPALPGVRAAGAIFATTRSALGSPETLRQARQGMHVEAQRLGSVRQEALVEGGTQASHRATELLAREVERSYRAEPRPAPGPLPSPTREDRSLEGMARGSPPEGARAASGSTEGATPAGPPVAQVESTLALIEKIEVFVKSQRPALGLSLRGPLEATVEVERTGPREVALRIQGRHGPVPSEDVARLRDALEARGLRLSVLRAG